MASLLAFGQDAAAGDYATWERLFGPADVSAVIGNGGLTVSLNRCGRVTVCRWPSPSYFDQISYRTKSRDLPALGVSPDHGLQWGIRLNDQTRWLADLEWRSSQAYSSEAPGVIETISSTEVIGLEVRQVAFVHPTRDLLALQLQVTGATSVQPIWYTDFSPCTRLIPESPVGDWAFDSANDFAAFASDQGQVIFHFRPSSMSARDWEHASRLTKRGGMTSEWANFDNGVWIGYTTPDTVTAFQCGESEAPSSAYTQACAGRLAGNDSALGQTNSALQFQPTSDGNATVYVAFGERQSDVSALLDYAHDRGFGSLRHETETYWREWLARATLPNTQDSELLDLCRQSLMAMAMAMDRYSGAMIRAPFTQPPLALDWPRHGAWMTYAWDMAGFHDLAEKHALFYVDCFRKTSQRGKPLGSLPAALFADRTEALPHLVLDLQAVAWTLWSFCRHAEFLDPESQEAFLSKVWPGFDLGAEFLVAWKDDRSGLPLHAFDPTVWRDAQTPNDLLCAYMGMDCAVAIAKRLRYDRPNWEQRSRELESLARYHCFDAAGQWRIENPIRFWATAVVPLDDPRWDAPADNALQELPSLDGYAAARTLCDLAALWQNRPDRLAQLRPHLAPTLGQILPFPSLQTTGFAPSRVPDTVDTSLCYISALLAFPASTR